MLTPASIDSGRGNFQNQSGAGGRQSGRTLLIWLTPTESRLAIAGSGNGWTQWRLPGNARAARARLSRCGWSNFNQHTQICLRSYLFPKGSTLIYPRYRMQNYTAAPKSRPLGGQNYAGESLHLDPMSGPRDWTRSQPATQSRRSMECIGIRQISG